MSIIEQTQLEIFTEDHGFDRSAILAELKRRLTGSTDDSEKLPVMRELLSEVIERYNDQYANYISPESLKRYRERRSGSYHGVGLKFRSMRDDYPVVIGPLIGGPLEHSDLLPGDKIIRVEDTGLSGKSSGQITALLKGPADTSVTLTLSRNGRNHTIEAKRSPVTLEYARAEITAANIGYIKISRFGGSTHKKVRQLVAKLLAQQVRGIVLDLRDNPGGSTRAARSITSIFIRDEHIYCERYKSGKNKLLPRHGDYLTDLPLAVLVNGNSMSSSEIVAGALQTSGRGRSFGAPTFGKGLVQKVFDLAPPLGGAIRTTIAEFATTNGQLIHARGIVPDKFISTEADFMFRRTGSLNISDAARAYQRMLLEQSVADDFPNAEQLIAAEDSQLNKAIDYLLMQRQQSAQ